MRFWSVITAILLLCGARLTAAQILAAPPYVRQWTQFVGDGVHVMAIEKGTVYYQCRDGVVALNLATGTKKWSSLAGQWVADTCLRDGILYALVEGNALYAIDASTGTPRLLQRFPQGIRRLTQDSEQLYVFDERGALHALSPRTGQVLWSTVLVSSPKPDTVSVVLAATREGVYAGIDAKGKRGEELGIAPESGKVLWRRKVSFPDLYSHTVIEGDVIFGGEKPRRINARTGNVVWTARGYIAQGSVLGNTWLTSGWDTTQGHDLATGKRLWRSPVPYGEILDSCSDGQSVLLHTINEGPKPYGMPLVEGTYCISREGKLLWQADKPFTGAPIFADQNHIVTWDQNENRLLGYIPGALPRLPATETEKKALAERLVAQFELLDAAERHQLEKLKPYSAPAFIAQYLDWDSRTTPIPDLDNYLLAFCEKENTAALLGIWKTLGERRRRREGVEGALKAKGEEAGYIPTFVQNLRDQKSSSSALLSAISHSSHPDAVAFLLDALRDPKAPAEWRAAAFEHLAGTGGAEGVAAIRAVRSSLKQPSPRKPWFASFDLESLPKKAVQKDAKGRTWALFQTDILGNSGDCFIVEKKAEGWGTPVFTGVWTGNTIRDNAPETFRGIRTEKLMATEWIKIFPDDPTLRKDTDGDGLTDLVEARLGTNPNKADTDGDGLSDAVDPCPTAAPRPLGDTEKILAACVEARFFDQNSERPLILFAPGVAPFEFDSNRGYLLWKQLRRRGPRATRPGGGFDEDDGLCFRHLNRLKSPKEQPITFGSDGQTARVALAPENTGWCGTFSGGEAFSLRKIDGDWFVVDRIVLNVLGEPMKRYYPGEPMW
ncbi:PQQ-binding-like beta-propeller repeat protein [Armatimonas sp.]|uniref:PQQ-binding-like beta-propeller repeat protein n=1 Tax=Armatimonas sp. TaxID=1872638 RepID=UPI003752C393